MKSKKAKLNMKKENNKKLVVLAIQGDYKSCKKLDYILLGHNKIIATGTKNNPLTSKKLYDYLKFKFLKNS